MLFIPALRAGKEKSNDRIFIQAEVYTRPIAIGTTGTALAVNRRGPPPGRVSTRNDSAVRARGRWVWPMAAQERATGHSSRRNHVGALQNQHWQTGEGPTSCRRA